MRSHATVAVSLLLCISACSSNSTSVYQAGAGAEAGGADTLGTDTSPRGGNTSHGSGTTASGGTSAASGGTSAALGGTSAASGGTSAASGGTSAASGGTSAALGGTWAALGGTSASTTKVDACLNVTCSTPPADTCVDATKAMTYSKTGSCLNGTCTYGSSAAVCKTGSACTAGACACTTGLTDCGASCLDLKTNANNCGACGHSCLGGTCSNGLCMPVVLASEQSGTNALALDSGYVYWTTAETITRIAKTAGTVEDLAVNQPNPRSVASDGTYVYWGGKSSSAVRRMLLGDSSYSDLTATTLPTTDVQPYGDWLYYVEHSNAAGGTSYIRRIAKTGGTPTEVAASTGGANEIAVVGDCVYYLELYTGQLRFKCFSTSGALGAVGTVYRGFDADNSGIYFGDTEGLKVAKLTTGAITTLVPNAKAGNIAVDSTHVYYIEGTSGSGGCGGNWQLWKVAKTGGTPVMLVDSPMACPLYTNVDNEAVYLYLYDDRSIVKVAK